MTWALKDAPVPDPLSHLVLIGIADHTADDGSGAWPSVQKLAEYARCSTRTVHSRLRVLEDLGLIVRGDQQLVKHLPPNRRPVVYDVTFGVQEMHPSRGEGDAGVNSDVSPGVNTAADKPSHLPTEETVPSSSGIDEPGARDDVEAVCSAMAEHVYQVTGRRPRVLKSWRRDARLMLDRDERALEDVLGAIAWVGADGFWCANVLSPGKLREKWPTLEGQARRGRTGGSRGAESSAALASAHARLFPEDAQ